MGGYDVPSIGMGVILAVRWDPAGGGVGVARVAEAQVYGASTRSSTTRGGGAAAFPPRSSAAGRLDRHPVRVEASLVRNCATVHLDWNAQVYSRARLHGTCFFFMNISESRCATQQFPSVSWSNNLLRGPLF